MDSVHVKETLSLLDRVHLFAIQKEGDASLQHVIQGIKKHGWRHYYSFKETNINFNFFSSLSVFYNMFMLVLEFKS